MKVNTLENAMKLLKEATNFRIETLYAAWNYHDERGGMQTNDGLFMTRSGAEAAVHKKSYYGADGRVQEGEYILFDVEDVTFCTSNSISMPLRDSEHKAEYEQFKLKQQALAKLSKEEREALGL